MMPLYAFVEMLRLVEAALGRELRSDIDYCTNHQATCMIPRCRVHG